MKETGIVMTGDHPVKIMADLKTMTRRLTKLHDYNKEPDKWNIRTGMNCWFADSIERNKYNLPTQQLYTKCPYGQVGARLWVRETWAGQDFAICDEDYSPVYLGKDGLYHPVIHKSGKEHYAWGLQGEPKWRSSRFMQKIATRIWLEITGVRVERLREITDSDIAKEGIEVTFHEKGKFGIENPCATGVVDLPNGTRTYTTAKGCFIQLWNSLNAKRGYGWDTNPWVWVIEFKRGKK